MGGNLGDRHELMALAKKEIGQHCGTILHSSRIYETAAWGKEDQQPFLNAALEVRTALSPEGVLGAINSIEALLGRQRDEHWGARTMDIDILFYDDRIIDNDQLQIPHPRLQARRFVLTPLCDIAPDMMHPVLQKSIRTLLEECTDPLPVTVIGS